MKIYENTKYQEDIEYVANLPLPWERLNNKSILVSGASGLIGSCLIDVIMHRNYKNKMNCKIFALSRSEKKAKNRFKYCLKNDNFQFLFQDINQAVILNNVKDVDYILHLASNTHPLAYAIDPIGTITTNVVGTKNMLDFAVEHNAIRVVFSSSNEIYGENRGDVEKFDECYCGYIDSNTMRAGYPESKRCGEALCQAFIKQKRLDIVIPRLTRSYGPTILKTDTKAISQFIRSGIEEENIVLKSDGTQYYSYTYVSDAIYGLLITLFYGECGNAYNIADDDSDIMLKDLAAIIAKETQKKVVFDFPTKLEKEGYSKATKARLNGNKIKKLGWKPKYKIEEGVKRTIEILKNID